MGTGFKYAGSFALVLAQMIAPTMPIAIVLGLLTIGPFVWGTVDLLRNIRIEKVESMRNSSAALRFDQNAKRLLLCISGIFPLIAVLSIYGASWYKTQYIAALEQINYVTRHQLVLPDYIFRYVDQREASSGTLYAK